MLLLDSVRADTGEQGPMFGHSARRGEYELGQSARTRIATPLLKVLSSLGRSEKQADLSRRVPTLSNCKIMFCVFDSNRLG